MFSLREKEYDVKKLVLYASNFLDHQLRRKYSDVMVDKQPHYSSAVDDDIICTEKIIADRKTFFIDLKSNARGRVVSSNRDRIMVPAEILDDFISALQDIRKANQEN